MSKKQNGFTLVELSIALVIIGMLIGGILVGQGLIDSAKLNSEIRRLQQYSIAIVQFRQKFKQEAGDSNLINCNDGSFCNNDGDNNDSSDTCPDSATRAESVGAWEHLYLSQMLKEKFVYDQAAHCVENNTVKSSDGKNFAFAAVVNQSVAPDSPIYFHQNQYGADYRLFSTNYDPQTIWGIETKLDDGNPSTGRMSAGVFGTATACTDANVSLVAAANRYCYTTIIFPKNIESPL